MTEGSWLVIWLTWNCGIGLGWVPAVLRPLACPSEARLEVRLVSTKLEAERILLDSPEDWMWVYRIEGKRLREKDIHWRVIVEP